MAPEALQMDAEQDHRVDVYSLGVVLFELLSGSVPFEGRYAEVLVRISTQELPSLAKLRPDVPGSLIQVVERCLAKDLATRFQSMGEVARSLSATLGSSAGPGNLPPRLEDSPPSRKRTLADTPAAFRAAAEGPASTPLGAGKRRFARAHYTTPAQLKLQTGEVIAGRVEEISEGGVQFIAGRGLAAGERGEFSFAEPITGRVVRWTAVSRWTKAGRAGRHATGFEFENASAESRASIKKYVELMGGS
jgi:hypothetical protein